MSNTIENEPLAIIGIGCRFPGNVNSPDQFWQLLTDGVDAITELPDERWNKKKFYDQKSGTPGKSFTKQGGFVRDIDRFDPQFFGISPREASRMDPQQRMLLETAWEAIDDAGQQVENLRGKKVAVFVGISSWEHSFQVMSFEDRGALDAYTNTGNALSIAANRIAYCFDFRGPSIAVDTACSSAMVAAHLACQTVWSGQSEMALIGGVNALLTPEHYVGFSQLGMLSPDGRCKAFDSRANGFVRSEGAGMLLLKPLSKALADGDRVYAAVRATGSNQDGRTPGITVPSQEAQEALLAETCQAARIHPTDIQYVEAHGTGTPVGDPIETRALGNVLAKNRPSHNKCIIGSVKTNIGHLEAGAGAASLVKVALSLYHRRIPGNLHFQDPNPEIDFDALKLEVATDQPWPQTTDLRLAGINSFGYGGTNAHAILQGVDVTDVATGEATHTSDHSVNDRIEAFPISARSADALRETAKVLADFLDSKSGELGFGNFVANAAQRRSHHEQRAVLFASDQPSLVTQLRRYADKEQSDCVTGRVIADRPTSKLAFVCAGQGPQWWGMGRDLLDNNTQFRDVIDRCDNVVRELGGWSLVEELQRGEADSRMDETSISQPCIFALQAGLAAVWKSWGIEPQAVVGHSVGEVAAAYLAGVFDLEDAARVIYQRGRCMDLAPAHGKMIAAAITVAEAKLQIEKFGDAVSIAAVNGPSSLTISGDADAIDEVADKLKAEGIFCKALRVSYAFHSKQMDPIRGELLESLADIRPRIASFPIFSTVTGERIVGSEMDAEYWWKNVRQSVLFADAVDHLIQFGCNSIVELSPHPVLTASVNECFDRRKQQVHATGSLRRFENDRLEMLRALSSMHVIGLPINWQAVSPPLRSHIRFPNYAWQKVDCWYESDDSRRTRLAAPDHPLLGCRRDDAGFAWQNRIDGRVFEFLRDHCVQSSPVLPASAFVELALATGRQVLPEADSWQIEDLKLLNPLVLADNDARWLTTRFNAAGKKIEFASREIGGDAEWTIHCSAEVRTNDDQHRANLLDENALRKRCPVRYSQEDCYEYFAELGLEYGKAFQGIKEAWRGDAESFTIVELDDKLYDTEYLLHPAFLDSCFQSVIPALPDFNHTLGDLYLPIEIKRARIYQKVDRRARCHAYFTELSRNWRTSEFRIYNEDGTLAAEINGLRSQRVSGKTFESVGNELLYDYQWKESPLGKTTPDISKENHRPWLIFADQDTVAKEVVARLKALRQTTIVVNNGEDYTKQDNENFTVVAGNRDHMERLLKEIVVDHEQPCQGIVHLWNLDLPHGEDCTTEQVELSQVPGVVSQLHLVQAWESVMGGDRASLFVVTQGAQTVGESPEPIRFTQGPAIGFGRVIIGEYPKLRCKLIDLDPNSQSQALLLVQDLLAVSDEEDEIAYRDEKRFVHRYAPIGSSRNPIALNGKEVAYRLGVVRSGTIDGLEYEVVDRQSPGSDEVEIQVLATALNFSDVMKSLGLYPGLEPGAVPLGAECSGIVTKVGRDVAEFRVGDEVLAFAAPAFGSHVVTNARLVAKKPSRLSFEEAATIPIAFLTAQYALGELGRMQAGERVLIHSASGGVGLAAVQLARNAGAELFATAGTEAKRDYLRDLGIQNVMHSRSLGFVDDVMRTTDGEGVDLILNSLPGDAIEKGLEILSEYGRFLEIGKRDIYKDTPVGLLPFRNNLSFFAIDLDRVMRQRPHILGRLLNDIVARLDRGDLEPIKHTVYQSNEIGDAFRFMQKGQHIGKIVISMASRPDRILPGEHEPTKFKANASYVITGGFGGFGLALANWMVERGAKNLVLLGRRGASTLDAQAAVKHLESNGTNVTVVKADVTDRNGLSEALQSIRDSLPPIRGVFHAAMILEDALLTNLDDDLLWRVLKPKLSGTWNLHQLTQVDPIDHFMLFSSLSSVFGHAGQGNYAAANAFLDGMAHYRRANNLPCLTVNWGHVGEVGYLAERSELSDRLERQGVMSFTIDEAMECLDQAMHARAVQVSVMRVEWSRWTGLGVNGKISPRFAHLMPQRNGDEASFGQSPRELVQAVSADERPQVIAEMLRDKIVGVLGIPAEKMDLSTPLLEFGLDSLMAVELRNWIETEFKTSVPIVELMRSPSLSRLSELVGDALAGAMVAEETEPSPHRSLRIDTSVEELLSNVDNMSEKEVDHLLEQLMDSSESSSPAT